MSKNWTVVIPPVGKVVETAQALLALAESPLDVQTQTGGQEFRVAPYVAELYLKPPPSRRRTPKKEGDE